MNNPLLPFIQELLLNHENGFDEFFILKAIEVHPHLSPLFSDLVIGAKPGSQLPLFKKHFMIMNALYTLQDLFWQQENRHLEITPLLNRLHPASSCDALALQQPYESQKVKAYYLDWSHFFNTQEEDVTRLYQAFWAYMNKHQHQEDALAVLGLPEDASQADIKRQYRKLVMTHHPDHGGHPETFINIRNAYQALKIRFHS